MLLEQNYSIKENLKNIFYLEFDLEEIKDLEYFTTINNSFVSNKDVKLYLKVLF